MRELFTIYYTLSLTYFPRQAYCGSSASDRIFSTPSLLEAWRFSPELARLLQSIWDRNTYVQEPAETRVENNRFSDASLLVVDDELTTRELCRNIANSIGLRVRTADTTESAMEMMETAPVDVVVTDLKVPRMGGLELLKHVRANHPHVHLMVLTQFGTIDNAVEAMRLGAVDYVTKPFHVEDFRAKLQRLVQTVALDQENRILREQLRTRPGFGGLIGTSPKMLKVYKLIAKVSRHKYPVLILGESGTGKELVASSIHFSGARCKEPFIPVDCSSLVPSLIESELFGYVKGAFTGAVQTKHGLIEAAQGGTLFLDEIGDLPVDLQAKLLRVLQEREIKPVGSTDRRSVDIRVIAATNRDLEAAINNGTFRQDLFFRLNVVQVKLPPLREHKADIPLLVHTFLEKFGDPEKPPRTISEAAMGRLLAHDWPGNVRELENAIERAVALGSGPILHVGDLPSNLQFSSLSPTTADNVVAPISELERRAILRALKETSGDKLAAARLLGIGKTTLYRKLKQYESEQPQN
jgi:DNA-binding NtrC family response regulator